MSLSVKVNLEAYPQDIPVGIVGVGIFTNGGDAIELSPSLEESYYYQFGRNIEDALKEQEGVTVTGSSEWHVPDGWEISDTTEHVTQADSTQAIEPVIDDEKNEVVVNPEGLTTGLPQDGGN